MDGFHDIDDLQILDAADVARRMGYASWDALYKWCYRMGIPRPPKIHGTKRFRGADLKHWFKELPSYTTKTLSAPNNAPTGGGLIPSTVLDQYRARLRTRSQC